MDRSDFPPDIRRRILRYLYDKPVINGGFVLGPAAKFRCAVGEVRRAWRRLSNTFAPIKWC